MTTCSSETHEILGYENPPKEWPQDGRTQALHTTFDSNDSGSLVNFEEGSVNFSKLHHLQIVRLLD
jgi:hypothetical protein